MMLGFEGAIARLLKPEGSPAPIGDQLAPALVDLKRNPLAMAYRLLVLTGSTVNWVTIRLVRPLLIAVQLLPPSVDLKMPCGFGERLVS